VVLRQDLLLVVQHVELLKQDLHDHVHVVRGPGPALVLVPSPAVIRHHSFFFYDTFGPTSGGVWSHFRFLSFFYLLGNRELTLASRQRNDVLKRIFGLLVDVNHIFY